MEQLKGERQSPFPSPELPSRGTRTVGPSLAPFPKETGHSHWCPACTRSGAQHFPLIHVPQALHFRSRRSRKLKLTALPPLTVLHTPRSRPPGANSHSSCQGDKEPA